MIYLTGDTHRDFKLVAAFCDTVDSTTDAPMPYHTIVNSEYFKGNRPSDSTRNPAGFVAYTIGRNNLREPVIVTRIIPNTKGPIHAATLIGRIYDFVS